MHDLTSFFFVSSKETLPYLTKSLDVLNTTHDELFQLK